MNKSNGVDRDGLNDIMKEVNGFMDGWQDGWRDAWMSGCVDAWNGWSE